ncbi:MAG TPA: hypothetical protein VIF62_32770 [Labilithrix sp.]
MKRGIAALAAVFTCWTAAVACGSVPDVTFGDGGAFTPPPPEPLDGPSGDAPQDSIVPGCTPNGAEVCDDGIDNDCNGHTDCDDAACKAGFACADMPAGFTVVAFAGATQPTCPAGSTPTDLKVVSGDGAATCACSCGGTCAAGNFMVSLSTEMTCSVAPTTATVPAAAATCKALAANITMPSSGFGEIIEPPTPTCAPNPSITRPSITTGRACAPARFGGGCSVGQVCAPKPGAGTATCVSKTGATACPPGYPTQNRAGSAASDTRNCNTGCACGGGTACTGGTLSLYNDNQCKEAGAHHADEGIATTCVALSDSSGFSAAFYSATPPTGGCGAPTSPATVSGTLSFTDERTVCCK